MNNFKNFKKFWEKEEPEIITTSNLGETGIYNQIHETYKYDKIDSEMVERWIKDFKQGMIDIILMGDYKKEMEMKMNRVELEMQRLRESTGENYMLNKMINTDGVNFFAEYTLYKDYDKYFGLTLDGESIDIVDIMEEEFAEFLSHYRLSTIYPQVEAVHEDTWDITPEENETIKEQMESGKTDKFTPMYDENDIGDKIEVGSDFDIDKPNSFSRSYLKGTELWTETPTNTNPDYAKPWTETSTNTSPYCAEPWGSGTISVGSGAISVSPKDFHIDDTGNKSDLEESPNALKNTENKSGAELITKIISDIIKELFTEGTCSINITLK